MSGEILSKVEDGFGYVTGKKNEGVPVEKLNLYRKTSLYGSNLCLFCKNENGEKKLLQHQYREKENAKLQLA